jgi:hypothetical protein
MKKIILTFVLLIVFVVNAQNQSSKDNQSRFSIIPSFGYAWRTADEPTGVSADYLNIVKQIKKGINFEINALYKINKRSNASYIGLKYNRYTADGNGSFIEQGVKLNLKTDDVISYFGPVYAHSNKYEHGELYFDVSLGYILYVSSSYATAPDFPSVSSSSKFEGDNLGFSASFSYLFKINSNFSLGPNVNLTTGTITEGYVTSSVTNGLTSENSRTFNKLSDDEKEGLGRISLNLQAKFNF